LNSPNRHQAYESAVQGALEKLRGVDMRQRCRSLGFPEPRPDGTILLRAFGRDLELQPPDFDMVDSASREKLHVFNRILVLRYLGAEGPLIPTGEPVSFRSLPSGMFYWNPFRERSAALLERRFGNDLELLRARLARFDWEPWPAGDLGASIHAIGALRIFLLYRAGDEEFPPSAEILFDSMIRRVYNAEDAAVLAQRICLDLLRQDS
jgi:hypothetical protein